MPNLNKVMLIGNVTRDPEVKYTPKGTAVAEVGLAINRVYTPEGGEKREETTFVDITFWGRQAEIVGEYAKKGRPIYVEGRLQLDTWDDKTSGQKRSRLRVVGEQLQLLGSRQDGGGGGGGRSYDEGEAPPQRPSRPAQPQRPAPAAEPEDDDIPF
jgi:single-strand DNA-binding protein